MAVAVARPLWLDEQGRESNVRPRLLQVLGERYGRDVTAPALFGYLAGVCAHPAYTATFADDLAAPGIRIPLTADTDLFDQVIELGRRVIWLHSYGQRFVDDTAGRPKSAPRLPREYAPRVAGSYPIPSDEEHMPDELGYDAQARHLHVGVGIIENVTPRMWQYEVSGVNVLGKWFSYRRRSRDRPLMGDRRVSLLSQVQSQTWRAEYTRDLIDLLNVLGLLEQLETPQAELLEAVLAGPLLGSDELRVAGVRSEEASRGKRAHTRTADGAIEPLFES